MTNWIGLNDEKFLASPNKVKARFWGKVAEQGDCWLFMNMRPNGYGFFEYKKTVSGAHRVSLLWSKGLPDQAKKYALHLCENRNCVKPEHLYWGSATDNRYDLHRTGWSQAKGENSQSAKISEEIARRICQDYFSTRCSRREIAERYGILESHVYAITTGQTWKHLNLDRVAPPGFALSKCVYGESHGRSKLTGEEVVEICAQINQRIKYVTIAENFNVSPSAVYEIAKGRNWVEFIAERKIILVPWRSRRNQTVESLSELQRFKVVELLREKMPQKDVAQKVKIPWKLVSQLAHENGLVSGRQGKNRA